MEQYIGNTFWANGGAGTGRTIQQTMQEIAGMGINVIRLPLVPQTLNANDPQGTGNVLKNHPSVRIANSRLALETMITAADGQQHRGHARHPLLLQLRGLEKGPSRRTSAVRRCGPRQLRLQARGLLLRGDRQSGRR